MPSVIVEAAVARFDDALAAERDGVDRIELCGPLHDGGTTPDSGLLARVMERVVIPVHVLIRPRAGDFVYHAAERAAMKASIARARASGAAGIATGALTAERDVDVALMRDLVEAARPMRVCFHRAFDQIADPLEALEQLIAIGIDFVLTSGGTATAMEGADRLRALVERARGRLTIVAAGSITATTVCEIVARTRVDHVHGRGFHGLRAALVNCSSCG